MNWLAKFSASAFPILLLTLLITSCKKDGDFNLGASPDATLGVQYTDTVTLINSTFLLNDSLISAKPGYLSFGAYNDPGFTGKTYAEAYTTLSLNSGNIDYSGVAIDSTNLYMYYEYASGDTLTNQDFAVHQLTTQLDGTVPYKTTSDFVTYDATAAGIKTGVQARPAHKIVLSIPLTNTFASGLLSAADDKSNADFQSVFYGIVVKSNNNSTGSVIRSSFSTTGSNLFKQTRLTVYFKRGTTRDSATFTMILGTPSFNRVIADRSGTSISSLSSNSDNVSDAFTNNKCYIQAGTGIVTKVTMPNLLNLAKIDGRSVIINKATLIIPFDVGSNTNTFPQVLAVGLLRVNPDNTYKYSGGTLAYVKENVPNSQGVYQNLYSYALNTSTKNYTFDITAYIQSLLTGKNSNDGFLINPVANSFYTNRTVLNSSNASTDKMRLEIYYTKAK
jgi:hypothetical protein